jgi:hypothetical protein
VGKHAGRPHWHVLESPAFRHSLRREDRGRDPTSRDELLACLDHLLAAAGNQSLMTSELRVTLADHAAGNYRVLMNLADELLAVAADRELARLDEKLFLEVFAQTTKPKTAAATPRKR